MIVSFSSFKGSLAALTLSFALFWLPQTYATPQRINHDNLEIKIGQAIFDKLWVFAPSSTKSSDGLGPLYNARSCLQCHEPNKPSLGHFPTSLVLQISIEPNKPSLNKSDIDYINYLGFIPEPTYGKQIQTFAYPGAKAEADVTVTFKNTTFTFADGEKVNLEKPSYNLAELGYGKLHPNTVISPRVAPRIQGLSWLEAIPSENLLSAADPNDSDNDGISGRVNWVWDPISQSATVGRFGWKAAKASLEQQNLAALSTDIGVSSWLFPKPEGDCTEQQSHCYQLAKATETHLTKTLNEDSSKTISVEASEEMTELLQRFMASLEPRKQNLQNDNHELKQGKRLFNKIACQKCHTSQYENIKNTYSNTPKSTTIFPYTDLLLHDMGNELADNRKEFSATGNEWRTAPLWGIAEYLEKSPRPHFLHDGRAKSIASAILWHGGEAESSKQAFIKLNKIQRKQIINFVESL